MSDGAFRDDQEAALARVDALEDELARAKRENEELRDKTARLESEVARKVEPPQKKKEPKPKPVREKPASTGRDRSWILIVGLVVLVVGAGVLIPVMGNRSRSAHRRDIDRVKALVAVPRCLRDALADDLIATQDAAAEDPRANPSAGPGYGDSFDPACRAYVGTLASMDSFASSGLVQWQAALVARTAAENGLYAYYKHLDWKDDDYRSGPAKWRAAQESSAGQRAAAEAFATRGLTTLETELRGYEAAYESSEGKDATWWMIDLGIQLQVAADDWMRGDHAKAQAEYTAIDAAAAAAPLEVRRAVRERSYKLESKSFKNELLRAVQDKMLP